jgi:hypothetical protein
MIRFILLTCLNIKMGCLSTSAKFESKQGTFDHHDLIALRKKI